MVPATDEYTGMPLTKFNVYRDQDGGPENRARGLAFLINNSSFRLSPINASNCPSSHEAGDQAADGKHFQLKLAY